MRARLVLIAAFWLAPLLPSAAAWGEDPAADKPLRDRWVTGLTFDVMLHDREANAQVESSVPGPLFNDSQSVPPPETTAVQYQVGLELMTPRMDFLPAAPRAWIFGGALVSPQNTYTVLQAGEFFPGMPETQLERWNQPDNCYIPSPNPNACLPGPKNTRYVPRDPRGELDPTAFLGQGSSVEARYLEGGWYLGLGAVFELPYQNSMVRLKPFVGYLRQRAEVSGERVGVFVLEDPPPPNEYPFALFRTTSRWQKQTQHFLGPGAEIELILIPGKSLAFSIFGQAQFLWNVSHSKIEVEGNRSVPAPGVPEQTATFSYTPDDFVVRGVLGARLAWRGGFAF